MAGVGDDGGGEVASYAEGPATINASDTQWGQISAQNTSDSSSSSAYTSLHQRIRHGEAESHFEIKGVNCSPTSALRNSLWSCPRKRSKSRLINQDQRHKVQARAALQTRQEGGSASAVVILVWGPLSPDGGPTDLVMPLRTSFPPPPAPATQERWRTPAKPQRKFNKPKKEDKRATLATGQIIAIGYACRTCTDKGFKYLHR